MTLHKTHEERRRDILDAARRRFVRDGYSRARLDDLARDAGLSKGGVYFHFRSKREIFDALLEEDHARVKAGIAAIRRLPGGVADKLSFFARAGLEASAREPDVAKFQLVMYEMGLAHEDVREHLRVVHESYVEGVRALLEDGVAAGELRADLDPDTGARLLVTLMDGVRQAVAGQLHGPRDLGRLIGDGARLLVEGLLPR